MACKRPAHEFPAFLWGVQCAARAKNVSAGQHQDHDLVKKFGRTQFPDYFYARNARNDKYKADQEGTPDAGQGLIFLYVKISRAFPPREGSFF